MNSAQKKPQPPPLSLPWFQSVNRFWVQNQGRFMAKIMPGEYYVTNQQELIGTVLGSCISACVRDPASGIGGMNHFMLPQNAGGGRMDILSDAFRYGNYAMEHLINDVMKLTGKRSTLEVKIFGGANVIRGMSSVGDKNIEFVRRYLEVDGFKIASEDVGGDYPRKILYDPTNGKVMMKRLKSLHNDTVIQREEHYMDELSHTKVAGDVDLF
ncbi:Chemotaxis protein, stimulates methylation of MCP protein [Hahella chejuensis KCTC 2396]|uniref:Probable chemoreceptor glutamine deamidase CheD n=1 Tax=Hahella chejuensis (strain KCTC 2396) TaxID=349521 RepID=CHED_HAHCH|nr:chemoreceptor glutamine deamidase CheD [Hahella chejuensis]Q2SPQ2.1 RecName: Full=Probable chemoreceptor glutamine deamidase CheD [Hahella chejuensis KCTC 2396]ABC27372.1 Chemotaxis protein, stimulates methylation of MCP protein [Hahella chejuensis KCTC 2396]